MTYDVFPFTPSEVSIVGAVVARLIKVREEFPHVRVCVAAMDDGRMLVAKIKKKSVTFTLEER